MDKTILIIDDFENTLFVTGLTIERAGYKVLKANSADDAINILKKNTPVSLIITDYNMPAMNGLQLVNAVKAMSLYKNIPIFMLSTETKAEIKNSASKSGITLWIQKPFQTDKLIEYIKRAIGK